MCTWLLPPPPPPPLMGHRFHMAVFAEILVYMTYFTAAWCVQRAVSLSLNLLLLSC